VRDRTVFPGLLICLFVSGASGLIYEVAWVRSLELVFGATSFAIATVLAAFMGGLALGSWLMGMAAARLERYHPLRVYAAIELLIGVAGSLVPPALRALIPVYQSIWSHFHSSFAVFSLWRFLLCGAVLLVPTALMGATLPIASRLAVGDAPAGGGGARPAGDGWSVGLLYACNTLGAVVGCAAAGLSLLPAIGLRRTEWLAVGLNLVAAAAPSSWRNGARSGRRDRDKPAIDTRVRPPRRSVAPPRSSSSCTQSRAAWRWCTKWPGAVSSSWSSGRRRTPTP